MASTQQLIPEQMMSEEAQGEEEEELSETFQGTKDLEVLNNES